MEEMIQAIQDIKADYTRLFEENEMSKIKLRDLETANIFLQGLIDAEKVKADRSVELEAEIKRLNTEIVFLRVDVSAENDRLKKKISELRVTIDQLNPLES